MARYFDLEFDIAILTTILIFWILCSNQVKIILMVLLNICAMKNQIKLTTSIICNYFFSDAELKEVNSQQYT